MHITELGGEYYRFDEARQELRGERTGMRYAIGTRVQVQVSRVDLDGRRIDFRLIHEGEGLVSRAMKEKEFLREGGARAASDDKPGRFSAASTARKMSEPLAEVTKSAARSLKL